MRNLIIVLLPILLLLTGCPSEPVCGDDDCITCCCDGTCSDSTGSGTCSHHDGVCDEEDSQTSTMDSANLSVEQMKLIMIIYFILNITLYIQYEFKKLSSDYYLRTIQMYGIIITRKNRDERYNSLLEESDQESDDVLEDDVDYSLDN